MRHRLAVSAASEIEGQPEAAGPTFSRSPQPRPLGLFLALLGGLLLVGFAAVAVLGAQFARIEAALHIVQELRPPPLVGSNDLSRAAVAARTEKIVSLNSFIQTYRSWDQVLQSLQPLFGAPFSSSSPLFLEEQLVARIGLAEGALSRGPMNGPADAPLNLGALLIAPLQFEGNLPSHLTTSMHEIAVATESLRALRNEINQIEESLSQLNGSIPALLEQVSLLHVQARRVLLLPESIPGPPSFVERVIDLESLLYQSGMLRGVPRIEGLPDNIASPEELVQGVAALGARGSADTSRSPLEAQQELGSLTSAGLKIFETVQKLADEERALVASRAELGIRARGQLESARVRWLEALESSLSAHAASMRALAVP